MNKIHGIHLYRLHAQLGHVLYETTRVQFAFMRPSPMWSPAINVYRCEKCFVVCADLAGVDRSAIELQVESRRFLMRGRREAPEPKEDTCKAVQVLAMEIDYGAFEREVLFPADVNTRRVTAEQRNGLLWIYFPFQARE